MEYKMIELATLPLIVQQYIQENGVVELRLVDGEVIATPKPNDHTSAEQDAEMAYYAHFYRHHFDRERLQQAIGETDENGCAKNVREVPQWELADLASFDRWLAGAKA